MINSLQQLTKQRCKCCLVGIHHESQCYARGEFFQPPELQKRIKLFNKQHRSKPPEGTVLKEWKPRSISADHEPTDNKVTFGKENKGKYKNNNRKSTTTNPFKNTATKTKTTDKQINLLEKNDSDKELIKELIDYDEDEVPPANFSAFINEQTDLAYSMNQYSDDEYESPVVCSVGFDVKSQQLNFTPKNITSEDPVPNSVMDNTPDPIIKAIKELHPADKFNPNKQYLLQHSMAINGMMPSAF